MSGKKRLVIVDANTYWTEQLFSTLAPEWDVLLVKPREVRDHMRRHPGNRFGSFVEETGPGVRNLYLPVPPKYTTMLWPFSKALLTRAIRQAGGDRPDVLAICFPDYRDLFETLRPSSALYYNYDDYSAHWPDRAESLAKAEEATIARSDLSVFIAKYRVDNLVAHLPSLAERLHHLPIGVTPAFMTNGDESCPDPAALKDIPHPRAGYIGALSYRFDFPFLATVAAARPDIHFVLGGLLPQKSQGNANWWAGVERARVLPNVHLIGWVEHATLGDHLSNCDVLLMPYAKCRFNDNACPAKLWDYLGTGKPIVANGNNPETLFWREAINVAETPETFAQEIERALNEADREGASPREQRLGIARDHTWEKLGERLAELIERNSNRSRKL